MGAAEIIAKGRTGEARMTPIRSLAEQTCDAGLTIPSAARCTATLLFVIVMLRTAGFARTLRLLRRCAREERLANDYPFECAEAVAQRVAKVASFYPGRARCLQQSLTVYHLLRRMGMHAEFRLGVQPVNFAAHAWVEYHGEPVLESELVHTVVAFSELPV